MNENDTTPKTSNVKRRYTKRPCLCKICSRPTNALSFFM